MGGKKNKKSRKPRRRQTTTLANHKQKGSHLLTPIGSLPNVVHLNWLRDQAPDFIWVAYHLTCDLKLGLTTIVKTINFVNELLDRRLGSIPSQRPVLDGRLTSWDQIPVEVRNEVLRDLKDEGAYEITFPEEFVHILGMYPNAPGRWLIGPWLNGSEFHIDHKVAERKLSEIIVNTAHGQSEVATRSKMLGLRGLIYAARVHFPPDTAFDLLPRWPDDLTDDERLLVESSCRAMFNATSTIGPDELVNVRTQWAMDFWRSNWRMFPCYAADDDSERPIAEVVEQLRALSLELVQIWERFMTIAMQSDPDIYDPDRWEVITGITSRSLRSIDALIRSPYRWTQEHLPTDSRAIIESLILLRWLNLKNDNELFKKFKEYGRGKLKLLKLHLESYADELDDIPDYLRKQIDDLSDLVNQDIDEEYQNIQLRGDFAGRSMRLMAKDTGMERDYHLRFAPDSTGLHGEWSHLDRYALVRCMNPTHRFHRIPRPGSEDISQPDLVKELVLLAAQIVDAYQEAVKQR